MVQARLAHSYSAIKMYENCPFRYYRQRVVKDVVDEGGEASRYGERIHKFLEDRLNGIQELPREVLAYEPLCLAVQRAVGDGTLYIEYELALNEDLKPTGWWDADAWLRSKLDVLVVNGEKAVVMDWKTGKRRPDKFQMELFAVQVFKHFPEVNEVKCSLVWLKDMSLDTSVYKREDSNRIWADVMARVRRIHQSLEHDTWPARPSGLCRYCPVRHDCDFAAV